MSDPMRPILPKSLLGYLLAALPMGLAAAQTASSAPAGNNAGSFRVAGTIVSKTDAHPLGRARVTLREASNPEKYESIITGDDGRFAFENVPAGKYSLTGAKRG